MKFGDKFSRNNDNNNNNTDAINEFTHELSLRIDKFDILLWKK